MVTAGPRAFSLLLTGCALAACSGGSSSSGSGPAPGSGSGPAGSTDPTGIWSATLTPEDTQQASSSGWLVVAADGSFRLDTDAAQFNGTAKTSGTKFSASTVGHPFAASFSNGSAFSFNGTVIAADSINGSWSGAGGKGTFDFHYNPSLSQLPASLSAIAGAYQGELWIQNTMQEATITITASGALTASTTAGCMLSGTLGVADGARNGYQWSGAVNGCAANGTASGIGFLIDEHSLYLTGNLPGGPVWMGGVAANASNDAPGG
jgi:hypothetical protein